MQWLFFILFVLVLVAMYLSIRRQWLSPMITAAGGVFASIVLMILFSIGQQNLPIQAVIVGTGMGALFSIATLVIAIFFQRNEQRALQLRDTADTNPG
jgi:ABC-type Fe3+-siderophore transport system permease subunit